MALLTDNNNNGHYNSQSSSPEPKSEESQPPPNPIPNGGFIAWLQVVGSFMAFLNTWYVLSVPCLLGSFSLVYLGAL